MGKGWINADGLNAYDQLVTLDNHLHIVKSNTRITKSMVMYNFEIADYHTFAITDEQTWVHNCGKYKKQTGSYTNTHKSGRKYHGKGSRKRSQDSGERVAAENNDPHVATDWIPSTSHREAFKAESRRLDTGGGAKSSSNYNKIEQPGKKYRIEDGEL